MKGTREVSLVQLSFLSLAYGVKTAKLQKMASLFLGPLSYVSLYIELSFLSLANGVGHARPLVLNSQVRSMIQ